MKLWTLISQLIMVGGVFTALGALVLVALIEVGQPNDGGGPIHPGSRGEGALISGLNNMFGARPRPQKSMRAPAEEWPQQFVVYVSPRPSSPPEEELNWTARNCECDENWRESLGTDKSVCKCNGKPCAARVNPKFISEAVGQDVCSLRRHTGYSCTLGCDKDDVHWYGKPCGE